jgi:hypothetical protein
MNKFKSEKDLKPSALSEGIKLIFYLKYTIFENMGLNLRA